jgi:hypothetical protein
MLNPPKLNITMLQNIILSANKKGITRAVYKDGKWFTENVLLNEEVNCLARYRFYNEMILAGTQGNGIFISKDSGSTWTKLNLEGVIVKSIATAKGQIWAGVKPANVMVSYDEGVSWLEIKTFRRMPQMLSWFSPAEPPFTAYVLGLDVSPEDNTTVVAGIEFGGVHISNDGGKTWKGHIKGAIRDCHNLFYHKKYGNYIYQGGGTGTGAAISRDGGKTWNQYKEGLDRSYGWAVAADPENPEIWYASLSSSPMKAHSADNANAYIFKKEKNKPWQKLSGSLPEPIPYMPYSLITTEQAGFVAAGLGNGDVWWSDNYGESWNKLELNMGYSKTMIFVGKS